MQPNTFGGHEDLRLGTKLGRKMLLVNKIIMGKWIINFWGSVVLKYIAGLVYCLLRVPHGDPML